MGRPVGEGYPGEWYPGGCVTECNAWGAQLVNSILVGVSPSVTLGVDRVLWYPGGCVTECNAWGGPGVMVWVELASVCHRV